MDLDLRAYLKYLSIYLLFLYGVRGLKLSINEDIQLMKQLKFLNKPAVKTIETIHGDSYNCVDFYKQHAFEHPLLKNHSFFYEMKPSSYPKGWRVQDSSTYHEFSKMWLNGKGCPKGTVPIKKITKEEIIKANKISKKISSSRTHELIPGEPGVHYAGLRTKNDGKFKGAAMSTSLYNPPVQTLQFSASQMKIHGGSDFIQVGWMVNPSLYKDNLTRNFIFTHTNRFHCFNTLCPGGFVLVRSEFAVDSPFGEMSTPKHAKSIHYMIRKDVEVWWLMVGKDNIPIGFWPNRIFSGSGLVVYANHIEWGGEVYSPPDIPSPIMGSGRTKKFDIDYDSDCYNVEVINEDDQIVRSKDLEVYSDNREVYGVYDRGDKDDEGFGRYFFYGGDGGITGV